MRQFRCDTPRVAHHQRQAASVCVCVCVCVRFMFVCGICVRTRVVCVCVYVCGKAVHSDFPMKVSSVMSRLEAQSNWLPNAKEYQSSSSPPSQPLMVLGPPHLLRVRSGLSTGYEAMPYTRESYQLNVDGVREA